MNFDINKCDLAKYELELEACKSDNGSSPCLSDSEHFFTAATAPKKAKSKKKTSKESKSKPRKQEDDAEADLEVSDESGELPQSSNRKGKTKQKTNTSATPSPVKSRRSAAQQVIDEAPAEVEPRARKPVKTFSPDMSASTRQGANKPSRGVRSAPQKIASSPNAAAAPAAAAAASGGSASARSSAAVRGDLPPPPQGHARRAGKSVYTQDELTIMVQWVRLCEQENAHVLKPRGNKMWHVARAMGLLLEHTQQSLWTKWKSTFHGQSDYWTSRSWASIVPPGLPDGVGEFLAEIQVGTPIPTVQDAYELFLQGLPGWAALMNPKRGSTKAAARKPRGSPKRKAAAASSAAVQEAAREEAEADAIDEEDEEEELLPPARGRRAGRGAAVAAAAAASPAGGKKRRRSTDAKAASALGKKARSAVASSPARSPKRTLGSDEVAATLAQEIGVTVEQAAGVLTATGGDYEMAATMLQVMVQRR